MYLFVYIDFVKQTSLILLATGFALLIEGGWVGQVIGPHLAVVCSAVLRRAKIGVGQHHFTSNLFLPFSSYIITTMSDWAFVHIPKTAGAAIELAAKRAGVRWGKFVEEWDLENPTSDIAGTSPLFHHPPAWHSAVYSGKRLFAVVRNPFTRLLSVFVFKYWGAQEGFDLRGNNPPPKSLTPEELNRFVHEKVTPFFRNGEESCDNHLFPQAWFTHGEHKVDRILKFENLAEEIAPILLEIGAAPELPVDNRFDKGGLSVSDFDSISIALIRSVYREDFLRFGYSFELPGV